MEVLYRCCAGLDVHLKTVMACVRESGPDGQVREQIREFGTTTAQLLALGDWLKSQGVSHVAMESTGVYWKPLWNLLEGLFGVLLVNARHIKNVPGRKTDVKDCQWIAHLLACGLLKASFVPQREQRELRDLTRHRAQLVAQRTQVANRLQKVLEDANIKLSSVISDVLGASGRDMIGALIQQQSDPQALAQLARGRMRSKLAELQEALQGQVRDHHRFMLQLLMDQLQQQEELIRRLQQRIEQLTTAAQGQIELLDQIPGIDRQVAQVLLAEVGTNMNQFPSEQHLCSWAGVCPGSNESAGKQRSGRCTQANRWLKAALTQAAWAASHVSGSYLSAFYHRLARRRGRKRALLAVAHAILVIVYHVLKEQAAYRDLGADYFQRQEPQRLKRQLVARLESLGYRVVLEPQQTVT